MSASVPQQERNHENGLITPSQQKDQAYLNLEKIFNQPPRFVKNKPAQSPTPDIKFENSAISRIQAG